MLASHTSGKWNTIISNATHKFFVTNLTISELVSCEWWKKKCWIHEYCVHHSQSTNSAIVKFVVKKFVLPIKLYCRDIHMHLAPLQQYYLILHCLSLSKGWHKSILSCPCQAVWVSSPPLGRWGKNRFSLTSLPRVCINILFNII